jgi:hypothetical protein
MEFLAYACLLLALILAALPFFMESASIKSVSGAVLLLIVYLALTGVVKK